MEGAAPLHGPPAPAAPPTGIPIAADNYLCPHSTPLSPLHHDAPSFEFETRRSPPKDHRGLQRGVSFADELFQDGRILPLKLPPRLQHASDSRVSRRHFPPDSPTSPSSASWRLRWRPGGPKSQEDFDPFTAALERVRKAEAAVAGEEHGGLPTRRARSLSPLRMNMGCDRVAERRRAPSPQVLQPWRAHPAGPSAFSTWTTSAHVQVMKASSKGGSGSENRLRERDREGGSRENPKFYDSSATDRCGERGVVRKGLGKKKTSTAYWGGLFFCLGFHV